MKADIVRSIKVHDKHNFYVEVTVNHYLSSGISMAIYEDSIIASFEYGKLSQPISDDDMEWEVYEQRCNEFADEVEANIYPTLVDYFNSEYKKIWQE